MKKGLKACGLPISGTKDQMLARLLDGGEDKRKSKGKRVATGNEDEDAFQKFAEEERVELVSKGVIDDATISDEIDRRWAVLKSHTLAHGMAQVTKKSKSSNGADESKGFGQGADVVTLTQKLPDAAATLAQLQFVSKVPDGFMYMKINKTETNKEEAEKSQDKEKDKESDKKAAAANKSIAVAEVKVADAPEAPEPGVEEGDITWACEVSALRIINKLSENTVKAMMQDFGISHMLGQSKNKCAKALGYQLHYETDDDEGVEG